MPRQKKSINKVLLVNPAGSVSVYYKSKISAAVPKVPAQAMGQLAACLLEEDFEVEILDLLIESNTKKEVARIPARSCCDNIHYSAL